MSLLATASNEYLLGYSEQVHPALVQSIPKQIVAFVQCALMQVQAQASEQSEIKIAEKAASHFGSGGGIPFGEQIGNRCPS